MGPVRGESKNLEKNTPTHIHLITHSAAVAGRPFGAREGWTTLHIHKPVLLEQTLSLLQVTPGGTYVDCTLGSGGHTSAIVEALEGQGTVVAIDQDGAAIERSRERLGSRADQVRFVRGNFAQVDEWVRGEGINEVNGILMDIGISSDQLEDPAYGMGFMHDAALDMRMDKRQELTAATWLLETPVPDMIRAFRWFGEERSARRIGEMIGERRRSAPLQTTSELAELVSEIKGGRRGRIHPATQVFQAIRIVVNRELDVLDQGLSKAINLLASGGRLAVISFHSLEDRRVKKFFSRHIGRDVALQQGGSEWQGDTPQVLRVTRKPVTANDAELEENPRARSAKLRVVERV